MQTRNDGTHAILPAAEPIGRPPDRVVVPVMLPRESDGKMYPDGQSAATAQPEAAVGECGGLHGAPELLPAWRQGIAASWKVEFRGRNEKRRCPEARPKHSRLGPQDKAGLRPRRPRQRPGARAGSRTRARAQWPLKRRATFPTCERGPWTWRHRQADSPRDRLRSWPSKDAESPSPGQ